MMKKLLKALGITALAASLIPYRVRKDEESHTTSIDALLWQATRGPGQGEEKEQIDISLGFKSPLQDKREESVLFADDEPEAAVVSADMAPAAAGEAQAIADEAQDAADEAQDAADEAQAIADEAQDADDEAGEAKFDPEA